jgi:ABC-type Fe3+ transport system substrate-binding protein
MAWNSTRAALGLTAVALAFGLTVSGSAYAAEADHVAAAEKEGQVVVYGDLNALPAIAAGFQAKYPKVKVVTASGDAWQMYNRFLAEKQAGRPLLDVFFLAEDIVTMADQGGHLAVFQADASKGWPKSVVPTANGTFVLGNIGVMMLAWNRDAMGKRTLPKDWTDFAAPPKDWQGLIAVSNPASSAATFAVFGALYQNYGPDKGATILQGLKKIDAEPTASIGVQNTKVQTGERPLAFFMNSSTIATLRAQGTPIDFAVPASGAVAQSNAVAITANAPHPGAARLFVEYALGAEGQGLLAKRSLYAARPGMPAPSGLPAFNEIKFMPFDLGKALKEREQILAWWKNQTGFGPK